MDIFHNVSPNDGVQVGLHEVKYQVDIFVIFRFEDVKQRHNVGVAVEFLQENDLDS